MQSQGETRSGAVRRNRTEPSSLGATLDHERMHFNLELAVETYQSQQSDVFKY